MAPWAWARFIPTCVGNTPRAAPACASCAVHPHVRGEYFLGLCARNSLTGSSPRAWGIPWQDGYHPVRKRFIPTCVGNTASSISLRQPATVHPHVRGEYEAAQGIDSPADGSSPRAWGIQKIQHHMQMTIRFIPTCVGNTVEGKGLFCSAPVHPHVRGEYKNQQP